MKTLMFLLLGYFSCMSQNVEVTFLVKTNFSFDTASENSKYVLKQNEQFSIFELIDNKNVNNLKHPELATLLKERDTISFYSVADQAIVGVARKKSFKNFKENFQISTHNIEFKHCYVRDKIDVFEWEIIDNSDTLIDQFKCKKAKTKFRGREYIACFSADVANQGGPYKFDGLPGFILAIRSLDGFVSFEPTSIKFIKKDITIENPFVNKKIIVFEDLKQLTMDAYKMQFARAKSSPNPPISRTFGKLEQIEDIGLGEVTLE